MRMLEQELQCRVGVRIKPKWNVNNRRGAMQSVNEEVRIKPKWNVNAKASTRSSAVVLPLE